MKKGISIWCFAETDLRKNLMLAKDAGFDGVELSLGMEGDINLESTKEDMEKISAMAKEIGIELYSVASVLYWDYSITSNVASEREMAKKIVIKQLDVASWLGCDTILVVPGAVGVDFLPSVDVVEYDVAYNRSLEAFRELAPYAEKVGVSIGVENVWNKFLISPLEMADFVDKIGSDYVGAYFDVGNVLLDGYPEHWIKILNNRIRKVHFKDYRRASGGSSGFVDLLAGDVNYPAVMNELHKIGYNGWVSAEISPYGQYPEALIYNISTSMDKILGR